MTEGSVASRVGGFLPVALFVFFLSYVAFEVVHLVHSSWNWRRTAKGCFEAFIFLVLCLPVVAAASFMSSKIAYRFDLDEFEEAWLSKELALSILVLTLLLWNGRRWKLLRKAHKPTRY